MVDSLSRQRGSASFPLIAATLIVVLLAGGVAYYLFHPPEPDVVEDPGPGAPPVTPLFDGWETPAAVLVFTGEQHGYLEPCGCTGGQTGGLRRRAGLFQELREDRGWLVAAFDLGGALHTDRVGRRQERIKFETTRAALREMGYDGMAWGPEELRLMADGLYGIFQAEEADDLTAPEFLCANISLFGERDAVGDIGTPRQFTITTVNGVDIGATAVVGEAVWERLFPGGLGSEFDYAYEPPATALERVLPAMTEAEDAPDVMVLLSHCDLEESRALAEQFPQFDVIVTAGGTEDGNRSPEPIGGTWLLQVGRKGKHAGVVGIYPDDPERPLRFELVEISADRFSRSPEIHELMRTYQQRVEQEYHDLTRESLRTPNGSQFVGAETCGACHTRAYAVWSETRHAQHAYQGLIDGREGETDWIWRNHDPECLCCHTTGWNPQTAERYESGFVDEASTPHLAGQQCENCHGAGSRHVAFEQTVKGGGAVDDAVVAARREMQRTKDWARENLCVNCHDGDNSPTFDSAEKPFETYWWPRVRHEGKD